MFGFRHNVATTLVPVDEVQHAVPRVVNSHLTSFSASHGRFNCDVVVMKTLSPFLVQFRVLHKQL